MKQSCILSIALSAALSAAHGIVSDMKIGDTWVGSYNPYQDQYMNPVPERITWAFPTAGNGPVEDVTTSDITCNKGATAATISQNVAAGADIDFFWTVWPESHKGPVMTYMAACPDTDCTTADPTTLSFFKIDEAGYDAGVWASDTLIANNNSHTVTVPSDIKPGPYIIRHELLALHSAGTAGGAQFYPMCANLVVEGSGTAEPEGVKFPGAYAAADPGITVNIYGTLSEYVIPGPAVYGSSGTGSGSSNSSAPAASSTAAVSNVISSTAVAATSEAAVTSEAAAPTTEAAAPTSEAATSEAAAPTSEAATTEVAAPTTEAAAPATTVAPTTLVTLTRTAQTTTTAGASGVFPPSGAAPSGTAAVGTAPAGTAPAASASAGYGSGHSYGKTPEGINKCLDAVNACIARAQRQRGNGFRKCENQRSSCY